MNLPEKYPMHHDPNPAIHQTTTWAKWRQAWDILHLALPFVIAGAVLCTPVAHRLMQITDLKAIRWASRRSIQMQWMR